MIKRFCAALVFAALSWPPSTGNAKPLTTVLLVARAEPPDPGFEGSIVHVMNQLGSAPVGVILKRPTPLPVSGVFPELERRAPLEDNVYFRGLVALHAVSFQFHAHRRHDNRDRPLVRLRFFLSYSTRAPGQRKDPVEVQPRALRQ